MSPGSGPYNHSYCVLPVTAVIPVHNRADLLSRLLTTIRTQTVAFSEIVVVDNGSADGAANLASEAGCRVVRMGGNAGFARAVNRGWKGAADGWIGILNSDVELDPEWLERLLAHASNASFATGTILNFNRRDLVDGTYDLVSRAGCAWRAGFGRPRTEARYSAAPIAIAPATACLFRRAVLEHLGGFDESFESYLEDVDLGLRCVRAGFSGVYVPDAIAWHHGSATFGSWDRRIVRLISRNQLLLVSRHYDRALLRSCLWRVIIGQLLWGMVALRHGAAIPWIAGKWEGLRRFRIEGTPSPPLREFLAASEHEIRTRSDEQYWRWYFTLTASRRLEP